MFPGGAWERGDVFFLEIFRSCKDVFRCAFACREDSGHGDVLPQRRQFVGVFWMDFQGPLRQSEQGEINGIVVVAEIIDLWEAGAGEFGFIPCAVFVLHECEISYRPSDCLMPFQSGGDKSHHGPGCFARR